MSTELSNDLSKTVELADDLSKIAELTDAELDIVSAGHQTGSLIDVCAQVNVIAKDNTNKCA